MTTVSALVTRASNEINDLTTNTFASSMTGIPFSELTQYAIDGIADYSDYVYIEASSNAIVTSANLRSYVVSGLSPAPEFITKVEYVYTSTSIWKIPEVELWNNTTMFLYDGQDHPLYTRTAGQYLNIFYLGKHTQPSAASATVTLPAKDEELIVNYIKGKALTKMALDQRGINQDSAAAFMSIATAMQSAYEKALKRSTTVFTSYKG